MKKNYLIVFIIGLVSCNGFGPVDMSIQTKNIAVFSKEIVGTWEMDVFSYKYLTELKRDSIAISFKVDNTFEMNNSDKLFDGQIDNKLTQGTWEIIKQAKTKIVKLNFDKANTFKVVTIYKKRDIYQLWYFFSDPDSGKRIRFIKK